MAFTRVRTIKGRQYLYREERWREGKKVKSRSILLRALGAAATNFMGNLKSEPGARALEKSIEDAERGRAEALAKEAAEKKVPTVVSTKETSTQPFSETAPHSPGSDETASEASPR